MREFLLLIILFSGFSNAAGKAKYSGTTETFRSPVIASYYGDYLGFKPGIHLGIERPVLVFRYHKDSTEAEFPEIERSFLTSYNFIVYHHKGYTTSMQLFPSLVYRSVRRHGLILDIGTDKTLIVLEHSDHTPVSCEPDKACTAIYDFIEKTRTK